MLRFSKLFKHSRSQRQKEDIQHSRTNGSTNTTHVTHISNDFFMGVEKVRKTIKNYGKKCERLWENRVILYFFSRHIKLQQKVGTYMAWYIQDEDTFYALFFSIFCWNAWYIKKVILKNDFIEVIFVCADGECLWHYDLTICESSFHFLRIW